MSKKVSFVEGTKEEREIIPGKILGTIIDMEINGIFPERITHRFGKDLFATLEKKDKKSVMLLLNQLIKNIQVKVKEAGTIETKISIPICASGQSGKFIEVEFLPQCLKLRDILQGVM